MNRPLQIALLSYRGNMRCGGQGVYLWHLARELARRGHAVDVLVGPPPPDPMPFSRRVTDVPIDGFWARWFERRRAPVLPARRPWGVLAPLRFYELGASRIGFFPEPFVFSARAFRELARRGDRGIRYDVVHDVQSLGWGLLAIRALGVPVLSTVHHPLSVDRRASLRRDRTLRERVGTLEFHPVGMQAAVARRLDAILTSSAVSRSLLIRDFGVARARIHTLANGLDTDRFAPARGVPRAARELLCVGRAVDPNKGISVLLEAFAALPPDVALRLVDSDGPGHPVRAWARSRGLEHRISITGPLGEAELVAAYRRAALVVVPSRFEGFGLPAVEALACETPVVATRAGALPEILGAVGGGVLVDPDDPRALAAEIRRFLAAPAEAARLARDARRKVVEQYAWPRIAAATERVYRTVLGARGRPDAITTSARWGRERAHPSRPASKRDAAGAGRRSTHFDQPGAPQPSEAPTHRSSSSQRPSWARSSSTS